MREKIFLTGEETSESLAAQGLSRTTIWRALRRGWYWAEYHARTTAQPWEPAGQFAMLRDPYAFALSQVVRVLHRHGLREQLAEDVEDYAQEGLMRVWEKRHEPYTDFVAAAATIICRVTKDQIKGYLVRAGYTASDAQIFREIGEKEGAQYGVPKKE